MRTVSRILALLLLLSLCGVLPCTPAEAVRRTSAAPTAFPLVTSTSGYRFVYADDGSLPETRVYEARRFRLIVPKALLETRGIDEIAAGQPNLMPRADLRRNRSETARKVFDGGVAELLAQALAKAMAGDQARAGKIEIEKAEHAPTCQIAGEGFELVELTCDFTSANNGANRRASDNVRLDTRFVKCPENADMRPAAGRAASERKADL